MTSLSSSSLLIFLIHSNAGLPIFDTSHMDILTLRPRAFIDFANRW